MPAPAFKPAAPANMPFGGVSKPPSQPVIQPPPIRAAAADPFAAMAAPGMTMFANLGAAQGSFQTEDPFASIVTPNASAPA